MTPAASVRPSTCHVRASSKGAIARSVLEQYLNLRAHKHFHKSARALTLDSTWPVTTREPALGLQSARSSAPTWALRRLLPYGASAVIQPFAQSPRSLVDVGPINSRSRNFLLPTSISLDSFFDPALRFTAPSLQIGPPSHHDTVARCPPGTKTSKVDLPLVRAAARRPRTLKIPCYAHDMALVAIQSPPRAELHRESGGWVRAHEELSRLARSRALLEWEEGRALLAALRAKAHRYLGFASFLE